MTIIIIGAGASGLMAAIEARKHNHDVILLEKNNKVGKKILATGNGRCNYTNVTTNLDHYNNPAFVKPIFDQFFIDETLAFFKQLGIIPKIEDEGKTYPFSEQASAITDCLQYELNRIGVKLYLEGNVVDIYKHKQFEVILSDDRRFIADKVIVSTGGKALPISGSDGAFYGVLEKLGHHVTQTFPALVKLKLDYPHLKMIDGVKIKSKASLICNNQVLKEEYGDILFTKYGISGPTILQLSRKAIALHLEHQVVFIKVDVLNGLDKQHVFDRFKQLNYKTIYDALIGLIPLKLIKPILLDTGIHKDSIVGSIEDKTLRKLIRILYDWRFKVNGYKGFEEAQVTAGGISLDEIDPYTLESKLVKGLYLTGEVLDIDGACGGFNLQWAWSSGFVAGKHAGKL